MDKTQRCLFDTMNNVELLEYSKKNPEPILDKCYMLLKKHKDLDLYLKKIKDIKELLITIKRLKSKKENSNAMNDILKELHGQLTEHANFSELGCFINACDITIEDARKNFDIFKRVTFWYLEKRDLNDIVPSEWVQALIDKNSSRSKGVLGEEKLIEILKNLGFKRTKDLKDFKKSKKAVAQFSSKSKDFSNESINKNFGTNFGKKNQGKVLDLIIKKNNKVYFLEAKHMNTGGGGQNKQILELIDIIKEKPKKKNHHYVSFLDGTFFDKYFSDKVGSKKNKTQKQQKDIIKALRKNKNNFFLNTAGFKKLFS